MSFSIIAAVAKNGVISKDNKLPWNIPEDRDYFYKIIYGKPVVMGRNTYEALGRPIKGSENVVLSHNKELRLPGCVVVHSFADVWRRYQNVAIEVMIIGGAAIYKDFLPLANKMYLTLIDNVIVGDVYFPKWHEEEWRIIDRRSSRFGEYSYSFLVLQRR